MKNHQYALQPYRGISSRHQCPECRHKGEFAFYIDIETNQPLNEKVGRCNRSQKCGYHFTPKQYFDENPNVTVNDWKPRHCSETQPKTDYLPIDLLPTGKGLKSNNLFKFFTSKFGHEQSKDIFLRYHVGTSKHWTNDGGLSTAFFQVDKDGRLRQIKIIAYNPETGHRLHKEHEALKWNGSDYIPDTDQDKVWFSGKNILNNYDATFCQCFFGEHLINDADSIAIVESEKTAMIASIFFPKLTWIATGGKNGCKWTERDVCNVLKNKKVFLYPDLKCLQDWTDKAAIIKAYGIDVHVSRWLEDHATNEDKDNGLDIADFLLKEEKDNPKETDMSLNTIGELLTYAQSIGMDKSRIIVNI